MTDPRDEGLTLVEIVVAMFMLGVVLVAMLPLMIAGIQASAENTTNATANQLVSERMERATNRGPDCSAIQALDGTVVEVDPRGISIELVTDVASCPASGTPSTVRVTTTATRLDTGSRLAEASTLVMVR